MGIFLILFVRLSIILCAKNNLCMLLLQISMFNIIIIFLLMLTLTIFMINLFVKLFYHKNFNFYQKILQKN